MPENLIGILGAAFGVALFAVFLVSVADRLGVPFPGSGRAQKKIKTAHDWLRFEMWLVAKHPQTSARAIVTPTAPADSAAVFSVFVYPYRQLVYAYRGDTYQEILNRILLVL